MPYTSTALSFLTTTFVSVRRYNDYEHSHPVPTMVLSAAFPPDSSLFRTNTTVDIQVCLARDISQVLQMKWLFALFDRDQVLRNYDMCHQLSIIPVMFQAFDHFGIDFKLQRVPIQTLLHLPLITMFTDLPSGHWLHRHTDTPAAIFFKFNENTHWLRLQVRTEYTKLPLLCYSLYNDVLIRHCAQLQYFLIPPIYNEVEQVNVEENDKPLVAQLHDSPVWSQYTSKAYRMHKYVGASNARLNLLNLL
ncbi:hypothetical protein CU098_007070 [Rhizopus stolonifer]|uniref:Uncharacterized protein n=1 Tax=Rhizopus stolonifer TaxID=4846 RepID=A0A367K3H7_RHIST|nr:hypothetical protein CU098_007070 [Rhizopus stolonifer]